MVTSGVGGAFPRNLAVGHVTRIIPGAVGLYQDVEVTPDVDFARLADVLVDRRAAAGARSGSGVSPRAGARAGGVSNEIRRDADRRLPAADPAVDGARAGAGAHGGAQLRPAGRAARRPVAEVDDLVVGGGRVRHRLPVRSGVGRAAGRARLRVRADGAVRARAHDARRGQRHRARGGDVVRRPACCRRSWSSSCARRSRPRAATAACGRRRSRRC